MIKNLPIIQLKILLAFDRSFYDFWWKNLYFSLKKSMIQFHRIYSGTIGGKLITTKIYNYYSQYICSVGVFPFN